MLAREKRETQALASANRERQRQWEEWDSERFPGETKVEWLLRTAKRGPSTSRETPKTRDGSRTADGGLDLRYPETSDRSPSRERKESSPNRRWFPWSRKPKTAEPAGTPWVSRNVFEGIFNPPARDDRARSSHDTIGLGRTYSSDPSPYSHPKAAGGSTIGLGREYSSDPSPFAQPATILKVDWKKHCADLRLEAARVYEKKVGTCLLYTSDAADE